MNNFKNEIKSNFTAIPNKIVNDASLSWKAKGIFLYLASKPDDWQFYMNEIKKNAIDGKSSLQTGIKELTELGYLIREKSTNENNQFYGWDWILTMPDTSKNRQTENPVVGKSSRREMASYNNKDYTNTDNKTNTEPNKHIRKLSFDDFPDDEIKKLVVHCWQTVKENYPDHKTVHEAKFDTWYKPIKKLIETPESKSEGYPLDRVVSVWNWAVNDGFWKANIRSTSKFAEQFETLDAQMKRSREKPKLSRNSENRTERFIRRGEEVLNEFSGTNETEYTRDALAEFEASKN